LEFKTHIELARGSDGVPLLYPVPISDEIETLYINDIKSKQHWKRDIDLPAFFFDYNPHLSDKERCRINASKTFYNKSGKLVTLSVEDTIELTRLIKREKERMIHGVYIMNDGEKIYLPGSYYGVLQWGKMFGVKSNGGYGRFLEYQHKYAIIRDHAKKTEWCNGYYCHKAKKTGITQLQTLLMLIDLIVNKQYTMAAMSKVLETAKKANFKYFLYGLKNLPYVLRPKIDQNGWQKAVQKIEMKCDDPEFSLENTFTAVSTTIDGLDGLVIIQEVHIDEPPKFPTQVPIEQVWEKTKEQVRQQSVKYGIIAMTSYPPEEDTAAFKWCRDFYIDSCKIVNGRPLNGIIPFFIGIIEGSMHNADIYGKPDLLKSEMEEDAERAKCKNAYEIQARQRQYAKTAKEGWQSGGGGSVYNNLILAEREAELQEEYDAGKLNYIEGNLEWTAGWFSKVRFVPLSYEDRLKGKEGKWKLYCSLEYLEGKTNLTFDMPFKIKYVDKERKFLHQPSDVVYFAGATDPVDYAYVTELGKEYSKNASIIKNLNGDTISVYHYREEDPDVTIEDFCMEILFFGHYTIVEGNRKHALTALEKVGLYYFMLVKTAEGKIVPYTEKDNGKPVCSGTGVISTYVTLITKRLKQSPNQFVSIPIIKQLKSFEADDTQAYDLAVCEGLCETALDATQAYVTSKKSRYGKYAALAAMANAI
jgi:hypothetical protein